MIRVFTSSWALRGAYDVKFNFPTIRFDGFTFGFTNSSTIFFDRIDFYVSDILLNRGFVGTFVPRSSNIRCLVFFRAVIILIRCDRAFV